MNTIDSPDLRTLPVGIPAYRQAKWNKDGTWMVETEEHFHRRERRKKWLTLGLYQPKP